MRKILLLMSALTLPLLAFRDDRTLDNSFSISGDFAYFKREMGHEHQLVIDNSETDCDCHYVSCDTKKLVHQFPFEPGFKVAMTYMTEHSVWDLSYLWLHQWEKGCTRTSSESSLIFSVKNPSITNDFNGADEGSAEYSSEFQNCTFNYFRYITPKKGDYFASAYLLGLRYINLKEALDVSFTKAANKSSYKVHTSNHIPTMQVGGLIAWNPSPAISWDFIIMAGIGFDIGEQKTFLGDENNSLTVRDYEKTGFSTPLLAEASLRLTYKPANYVDLHVEYQVIYLNGVALAPDQLVKSNSDRRVYRAIGAPLIHGVTAGLSWSF